MKTDTDGTKYPIGFWSRYINPAERNYNTGKRECFVLVWDVQILWPYLECLHFELFSNHQELKWTIDLAEANGILSRWRLILLELYFKVFYRKYANNTIADAI